MNQNYDPITLEIIQNSLQAIADEMFAALRKTAMSAIIYEVLDAGTGITDARGNLASSGAGIPGFVGVLDKAVKRILQIHGKPGDIEPGDDNQPANSATFDDLSQTTGQVVCQPLKAQFKDGSSWDAPDSDGG